ncbi:MAG: DUF1800 domain-containing protein, partial [Casimicrobiaceae bacterium]|nr:DUF1800 domain-containing protein [Casimicrobiaceae bacterium]
ARYLFGLRGAALTAALTPRPGATRTLAAQIEAHIAAGCPAAAPAASALRHAARLLQQGTWGASWAEIERVASLGGGEPFAMAEAWLNEQLAKPLTLHAPYAQAWINENKTGAFGWRCTDTADGCPWAAARPAFWRAVMTGEDQLKQRVINALWQILVVSLENNIVNDAGVALPSYLDMIGTNAFAGHTSDSQGNTVGNFRKLLRDMTLHPAMGRYLDMLGSTRDAPNENYARELLQLFSIGTVMLNQDGTPMRDAAGRPIPTYDEETVQGFSKAFTGWHFAGADSDPNNAWWWYWYPNRDWTQPMQPWTLRRCPQGGRWPQVSGSPCWGWCNVRFEQCSLPPPHDRGAKKLLSYTQLNGQPAPFATLPAHEELAYPSGQDWSAPAVREAIRSAALQDLERAIDNVFYHPNVGPFISRQLIQRLVTSNPTPGYVSRVAARFNDNGHGIRGDLRAVIRAIFLDPEARDVTFAAKPWFGKLREPLLKFSQHHRAFEARPDSGYYDSWWLGETETLAQGVLSPPSVFNYYSPDFGPSGPAAYTMSRPLDAALWGPRLGEPLYGPEFEITSTSTIAGFADFWNWGMWPGYRQRESREQDRWRPNYTEYLALTDNPGALIERLDLLLTAGNLKPGFKAELVRMVSAITNTNPATQREQRLRAVLWQIMQSADYAVQR